MWERKKLRKLLQFVRGVVADSSYLLNLEMKKNFRLRNGSWNGQYSDQWRKNFCEVSICIFHLKYVKFYVCGNMVFLVYPKLSPPKQVRVPAGREIPAWNFLCLRRLVFVHRSVVVFNISCVDSLLRPPRLYIDPPIKEEVW